MLWKHHAIFPGKSEVYKYFCSYSGTSSVYSWLEPCEPNRSYVVNLSLSPVHGNFTFGQILNKAMYLARLAYSSTRFRVLPKELDTRIL